MNGWQLTAKMQFSIILRNTICVCQLNGGFRVQPFSPCKASLEVVLFLFNEWLNPVSEYDLYDFCDNWQKSNSSVILSFTVGSLVDDVML